MGVGVLKEITKNGEQSFLILMALGSIPLIFSLTMEEFLKTITDIGGLGIAGLALLVFVYFLKSNYRFSRLDKKVNNEMDHRLASIERRLENLEQQVIELKEEVGYLRGKLNKK